MSSSPERERPSAIKATLPGLPKWQPAYSVTTKKPSSYLEHRRGICFLHLLAHQNPDLPRVLSMAPYNMPHWLIQQLMTAHDIQTLARRMGPQGVKFEGKCVCE